MVERDDEFIERLDRFVHAVHGKGYSLGNLFRGQTMVGKEEIEDERAFFCSELIAKGYKTLGIFSDKVVSAKFMPADFTQKKTLRMEKGELGPENYIIFDESKV